MAQPAETGWRPDPDDFRAVMANLASGVSVVTTAHRGRRYGMTVNSLTSVSLDPTLVLFCCDRHASVHEPLLAAGTWAVSVLRSAQLPVAQEFARRSRGRLDRFGPHAVRSGPATAAPLVNDALAWLECRTWATYAGGDHTIIVGEVLNMRLGDDGPALLYFRSRYDRTAG